MKRCWAGIIRVHSLGKWLEKVRHYANLHITWDWIYGASPAFNLRQTASFDWGNIDVRLDIKRGLVCACRIYGDYFPLGDIAELENHLIGTVYRPAEIRSRLAAIGLRQYLPQMSDDEMVDLLLA